MVRVREVIGDWFGVETIEDAWCGERKVGTDVERKLVAKMEELVPVVEDMRKDNEIENWEVGVVFGKEND